MIIGISGKIGSGKDTVATMIQYLATNWEKQFKDNYSKQKASSMEVLPFPETMEATDRHLDSPWEIKRFADKIKDTVCLWLGCTREQLEDREFKEKPLGEEWHVYYVEIRNKPRKIFSSRKEVMDYLTRLEEMNYDDYEDSHVGDYRLTPRKLLQLLGTEAGRRIIHPNIWVNATMADYMPPSDKPLETTEDKILFGESKWIIPDTRFPNEADAIKQRDGVTIRVDRLLQNRFPEIAIEYGYAGTTPAETQDALRGYIHREYPELDEKLGHVSEVSLDDYQNWDYVIYNNYSMEKLFEIVKEIYEEIT